MLTPQPPGLQLIAAKAREQRSDLLEETGGGRLVRKAEFTGHGFLDRVMTGIGDGLIYIGEKLREQSVPAVSCGSEAYQS